MPVSLGMVDHTLPVPAAEIDRKTMASTPLDDTDAEDIAVHLLLTIRRIAAEDILLTHEEDEATNVTPIRTMLLLTLDDALAPNSGSATVNEPVEITGVVLIDGEVKPAASQPSPIGYDVPAPSQSAIITDSRR